RTRPPIHVAKERASLDCNPTAGRMAHKYPDNFRTRPFSRYPIASKVAAASAAAADISAADISAAPRIAPTAKVAAAIAAAEVAAARGVARVLRRHWRPILSRHRFTSRRLMTAEEPIVSPTAGRAAEQTAQHTWKESPSLTAAV